MGGRYVYLIFYGTPIFFGGVCARYDSGIHFRNPLYLYCGARVLEISNLQIISINETTEEAATRILVV